MYRITKNNGSGKYRIERLSRFSGEWEPVPYVFGSPFNTLEEAQEVKARLEKDDYDAQWVSVTF